LFETNKKKGGNGMTTMEYLTSKKITPVIRIVASSNKAEAFVTMTIEQFEEYGKYCAEQAWAFAGVKTFNEWWAEFQRKEATE
jgi:hypothetical protein